jgi:hypothetical protein
MSETKYRGSDLVRGAKKIGVLINKTETQVYHIARKNRTHGPPITREGSSLIASAMELRDYYGGMLRDNGKTDSET